MLDYPEKTACIIFTPGCNMRCGFCHNPEFVLPERIVEIKKDFIPEAAVWNFLAARAGKLDGVVISGGEPTMQHDLVPFIRTLKEKGFLVKLDTNGNKPEVLRQLLDEKLVDYVAMDLKTDVPHYKAVGGFLTNEQKILESIALIQNSDIEYEFRSTLVKELHNYDILKAMAQMIAGTKRWYLQTFRPGITLDPAFAQFHAFSSNELLELQQSLSHFVSDIRIREA